MLFNANSHLICIISNCYRREEHSSFAFFRESSNRWILLAWSSFHSLSLLATRTSRCPSPLSWVSPSSCILKLEHTAQSTKINDSSYVLQMKNRIHQDVLVHVDKALNKLIKDKHIIRCVSKNMDLWMQCNTFYFCPPYAQIHSCTNILFQHVNVHF